MTVSDLAPLQQWLWPRQQALELFVVCRSLIAQDVRPQKNRSVMAMFDQT